MASSPNLVTAAQSAPMNTQPSDPMQGTRYAARSERGRKQSKVMSKPLRYPVGDVEDLEDLLMEFGIMEEEDETIVGVAETA